MNIVCLDLEGVLVPEIWIGLAERTGIAELRATTRDVTDYNQLMGERLRILDQHRLGMTALREVIDGMTPFPGAREFLEWIRERYQLVILSDTYYEFGRPFMRQLGWPTLFCHELETDGNGRIVGYHLRMPDHKRAAVAAFQQLNFRVTAVGDSYNDTGMLSQAEAGILFAPPQNVVDDFPQFPVARDYDALRDAIERAFQD